MRTNIEPFTVSEEEGWKKLPSCTNFSNEGGSTGRYFLGEEGVHEPEVTTPGHSLHPTNGVSKNEFDGNEDAWVKAISGTLTISYTG